MTDPEHWLSANDQYLATMLDWLRERLEHLAAPDASAAMMAKDISQSGQQPAKAAKSRLRDRLFRSSETVDMPAPGDNRIASIVHHISDPIWDSLYVPLGRSVGWIADHFGWTGVFVTMIACCVLTIAFSAMTLGHKAESAAR